MHSYRLIRPPMDMQSQAREAQDGATPEELMSFCPIMSLPVVSNHRDSQSRSGLLARSWSFDEKQSDMPGGHLANMATMQMSAISNLETARIETTRNVRSHGSFRQSVSPRTSLSRHLLFFLKAVGITFFLLLVDLPLEQFLLMQNTTYQIVNIAIIVIIYSNAISVTAIQHYRISFDMLKTTLHLKAVKQKSTALLAVSLPRHEHLRTIQDTTAYLSALKKTFSHPGARP